MVELGDPAYCDGVTPSGRAPQDGTERADTLAEPSGSLVGQTLGGRYRVTALLGSGGMGAVYRAEHTQLLKTVALKVLNPEMASHREAALRFEREAMVSARIVHPHVVNATDSGRLPDGSLYLVLEYVSGLSLRELRDAEGPLSPARALAIGAQIADALAAAHKAEIVHRDLKPGNVMLLSHDGNPEFVKVLDFGLARVIGEAAPAEEPLTRTGSIFGTPEYMSPEQARGEVVDHRADLYALGVILYELLSGKPPFQAPELVAVLIKHIQEPPPPLPAHIPAPIADYVLSLLEKHPDRRPADARQVAKALRRLAPQPTPILSTMPPEAGPTTLDHGGVRILPAPSTMGGWREAIAGIEWSAIARGSLARARSLWQLRPRLWLGRAWELAASCALAARGGLMRFGELRREVRVGLGAALMGVLAVGIAAALWPDDVPSELREAARQGEPEALGAIAALPPTQRGAETSVALATGYFSAGQFAPALDAVSEALEIDEDVAELPEVLSGVRRAVDDATTRERALQLAAKRLGKFGVDMLFDVWSSTAEKTPATRSAKKWLDDDAVRAVASAALMVALQIREAKGCTAVRELLPRVTEVGDARALAPLKRLQSGSGCGFLGLEDCYSCLRDDSALDEAIAAVTARPAPKF